MEIKKVLNNNAVISVNEHNQDIIITGLGIAFQKKTGDTIDEDKIERVFKVEGTDIPIGMQKLAEAIPVEFLKLAEEIVKYASETFNTKLSESTYITLADHLCFAVERIQNGFEIKNPLIWEVKQYYIDEFKVGGHALDMIEQEIGERLPDDEAAAIALHLVNARVDDSMPKVVKQINILQDSLNIVKYHFSIEFEDDDTAFQRMVTHLKFFAQRIVKGEGLVDDSDELHKLIRLQYPESYSCACKIKSYAKDEHGFNVTNSELTFLTVHIERVVRNYEK